MSGTRTQKRKEALKMIMRIKECREQQGLTRCQLGAETGVAPFVIESWEKESFLPLCRQLPRLAQVLGCSINDLFVPEEEAG